MTQSENEWAIALTKVMAERDALKVELAKAKQTPIPEALRGALEQLVHHQQQLDEHGTYVGVSRQALNEVLEWIERLTLPQPETE